MGVTGLWKLIDASGKPVALETLENKVLAIDISIWLHQVVKGYQDNKGGTLANAHLIGLFNRICKLLYFRIKPVFIFDGGVPILKRETIAKRLQSRSKIQNEADKFEQLLLESLAKEKIVQQALGGAVSQLLSPQKKYGKPKKDEPVDMFKLPPLKEEHIDANIKNEEEDSPKNAYDVNINTIDVTSSHFKSLPPDIRHDILTDIKETRKQNTWGRLRELPVEGNDFSTYQMSRLIRRRQVQTSLEDAEKEMGGKTWSLSELESLLSEDGVIQAASTNHAQRIASDEQTRFLLVRNVSKAIEDAKNIKIEEAASEIPKLSPHPSTSKESISSPTDELEDELEDEFDLDVQRAIQMSLGGNDIDQEFLDDNKTCTRIKLNPKQRQALSGTLQTHGLVRGFMMEYAEMNDTDIHELFDVTQDSKETEVVDEYRAQFPNNDDYVLYGTPKKSKPIQIEKHKDTVEIGVISDSDSDSDLEEVPSGKSKPIQVQKDAAKIGVMSGSDSDSDLEEVSNGNSMKVLENDSKICVEITVASDLKNYDQEEDLFADVFKNDAVAEISINSVCESSLDIVDTDNVPEVDFISSSDTSEATIPYDYSEIEMMANSGSVNEEVSENHDTEEVTQDHEYEKNAKDINEMNESTKENLEITEVVDILESPKKDDIVDAMELIHEEKLDSPEIISIQKTPIKSPIMLLTETPPRTVSPLHESPKKDDMVNSVETVEVNDGDKLESPSTRNQKTPTKSPIIEIHETPPKIASPFFVNRKTPESKQKDQQPIPTKSITIAKHLFPEPPPEKVKKVKHVTVKEAIKLAADNLRETTTKSELKDMATGLKQEQKKLAQERNKQDRMGTSITHNMERECKELLRLFGIPYVDSPMEAEAQCAFLNMVKLTDGTISDDSDIWLFGGQTVYKNFFVNKKMVMEFQYESIEKMFNLDRKKLIQLAMLVGSDYTTGINGVGAVTALEILAAFPTTPVVSGETDEYQSMISSLRKFREWFNSGKPVGPCGKTVLKSKLKNIELFEGFPNLNVARAYLEPVIDDNKENFSWGLPDTESLVEFAKMKLGWTRLKTDEILEPVMKRLNEKKQTTMKDYFKSQVTKKFFDSGTMSKRVQKAVGIMAGNLSDEEEKKKEKVPKKRAIKTKKKAVEDKNGFKIPDEDQNIMLILSDDDDMHMQPPAKSSKTPEKPEVKKDTIKATKQATVKKSAPRKRKQNDVEDDPKPSTSTGMSTGTRKTPRIPNTKQVIPQREKDKEEQEKAKQKAIQMFKKSQPSAVKKK